MRNPNRDIFGEVKETVSVPSAAEYYGMSVRNGMTTCIFHEDRNPSMKLYDDHFYCFGCTEYGDVVKLTARLFGLTQYEAAKKLCSDFGIIHSRLYDRKYAYKAREKRSKGYFAFSPIIAHCYADFGLNTLPKATAKPYILYSPKA